jgi:hypothetical protein
MSRHWRTVSKTMQKLAAGVHEVKSEGMSPYETCYVLATDKELDRLYDLARNALASGISGYPEPSADVPKSF